MAHRLHVSDRAILVVFGDAITVTAGNEVRALHEWLTEDPWEGIVDLHPAYSSVLIRFDPLRCDPDALEREIERRVVLLPGRPLREGRIFEIQVRYGGRHGPDLPDVARATGLAEGDVVAAHTAGLYDVRFVGFSPGFPYLGGLPERLHVPRMHVPRAQVAAGSVAIAGAQAGIYPRRSPGGWNVIGQTDFVLFDPTRENPATLCPGDRIRFIDAEAGS